MSHQELYTIFKKISNPCVLRVVYIISTNPKIHRQLSLVLAHTVTFLPLEIEDTLTLIYLSLLCPSPYASESILNDINNLTLKI